jgi:CheY-like chemotaxis protein
MQTPISLAPPPVGGRRDAPVVCFSGRVAASPAGSTSNGRIPAPRPPMPAIGRTIRRAGERAGRPPRVLVVDDDPQLLSYLALALGGSGFVVETAADGSEALRRVAERPPDAVVLDVRMPGLDGLEVCRRIRTGADLPVLLLTALTAEPDEVAGFEAGADDYLAKPFRLAELVARVRRLVCPRRADA